MSNRFQSVYRQMGGKVLLKGAMLMAVLVGIVFLGKLLDLEGLLKGVGFTNEEGAPLLRGPVGFLLLGIGLLSIGIPRQAISFFAALFFGLSTGFVLALMATVGGGVVTYSFARLFQKPVRKFIKGKVDLAMQFWAQNAFTTTLLIRLLPAGSNFLTNLAAGAYGLSLPLFVLGSAIGYIPQTLIFAIMGSGVDIGSTVQIVISIILFGLSALLGLWLYARHRKEIKRPASPE